MLTVTETFTARMFVALAGTDPTAGGRIANVLQDAFNAVERFEPLNPDDREHLLDVAVEADLYVLTGTPLKPHARWAMLAVAQLVDDAAEKLRRVVEAG
jgi:hypothetical protein